MHRDSIPLPSDHAWSARPGFKVVVADRGAARFDVPAGWDVVPGADSELTLTDRPPPEDECRLEFSLLRIVQPPGEGPPLEALVAQAADAGPEDGLMAPTPTVERHGDVELAWNELRYRDPETSREALSRTCLARGAGLHAVFTMSLWAADADRFAEAWDELRRSIRLGKRYDLTGRDPRRN